MDFDRGAAIVVSRSAARPRGVSAPTMGSTSLRIPRSALPALENHVRLLLLPVVEVTPVLALELEALEEVIVSSHVTECGRVTTLLSRGGPVGEIGRAHV